MKDKKKKKNQIKLLEKKIATCVLENTLDRSSGKLDFAEE